MLRKRFLFLLVTLLLVAIALVPWLLRQNFNPLRPPMLAETVTQYSITEAAFLTRDAQLELSATSEMFTLPPEDEEPLPGDPDYTPPATLASSGKRLNSSIVQPTSAAVTGISSHPLERYSCPSPSRLMSGLFPPNQSFIVLGWNTDLDNVTYLLVEDDPTQSQVWLRIPDLRQVQLSANYLDTPAITCRTYTVEGTLTVTTTPVPSDTAGTAAAETPTIPLPRIATSTPPPPIPAQLVITNEDARQQVIESVPELRDPSILISPEGIEIRGFINLPGPLGVTIRGDLVIRGRLVQDGTNLRMDLISAEVAGRNILDTADGDAVENAINLWLNSLLIRRDVQAFSLDDGVLRIDVLERQTSEFPTPSNGTETSIGTPTSIEETVVVSTMTLPPSPATVPVRTLTPTATGQVTQTLPLYTVTPG